MISSPVPVLGSVPVLGPVSFLSQVPVHDLVPVLNVFTTRCCVTGYLIAPQTSTRLLDCVMVTKS